jgi:hypothetical protein
MDGSSEYPLRLIEVEEQHAERVRAHRTDAVCQHEQAVGCFDRRTAVA